MNKLELGVQATAAVADAAVVNPGQSANKALVSNGTNWLAQLLVNANIDPAAAIAYSKLALAGSVVNNDIATAAAIALSKLADPGAGNVVTSTGAGAVAAKPPGYDLAYTEYASPVAISATTEATANTIVTASAVTFDGSTVIEVEFFAPYVATSATATDGVNIVLYDGAASIGKWGLTTTSAAAVKNDMAKLARRLTPSAGAHTYSVRAFVIASAGSVGAGAGGVGNYMPGYIRIKKV